MKNKQLPGRWKEVELGDYVNIKTGKLDANKQDKNGKYPFFTCSEKISRINNWAYNCECVLIAGNGDLNVKYFKGKFNAYQRTYIIEIENSQVLFAKYLFHFLNKYIEILRNNSIGGVIKYIKLGDLTGIKIPLPPIEAQEKIVQILEQAEQLKQKREQADELIDDYLKSVFNEMFGNLANPQKNWEIKPFDYFAKIDTNMTKDFEKYSDVPHIGIENIERDTGKLINYKLVRDSNIISGKYLFTKNHIIYSKIRPNLNKVALPHFSGLCSADSYPLLVNEKNANKYFFAFVLRSDYFLKHVSTSSGRANIPKTNKNQMSSFMCAAPPIELQKQFASIVEKVEKIKESQKNSKQEIGNLFNALMQQSFRGEIK